MRNTMLKFRRSTVLLAALLVPEIRRKREVLKED